MCLHCGELSHDVFGSDFLYECECREEEHQFCKKLIEESDSHTCKFDEKTGCCKFEGVKEFGAFPDGVRCVTIVQEVELFRDANKDKEFFIYLRRSDWKQFD